MPKLNFQFSGKSKFEKRIDRLIAGISEELSIAGERGVALRNKVTANWNHKPQFAYHVTRSDNRITMIVTFLEPTPSGHHTGESEPSPNKVWYWLDRGTKRKFVIASKDFSRKTKPNVVASYPGSGKVSKTKIPQKGIPEGNWDTIIANRNIKFFRTGINRRLSK